jgi:excisionase family DNA binding protein
MGKSSNKSELLSTSDAAAELGVTRGRVLALLAADRIKGAVKIGRDWVIPRAALDAVRDRKPGRPWPKS